MFVRYNVAADSLKLEGPTVKKSVFAIIFGGYLKILDQDIQKGAPLFLQICIFLVLIFF